MKESLLAPKSTALIEHVPFLSNNLTFISIEHILNTLLNRFIHILCFLINHKKLDGKMYPTVRTEFIITFPNAKAKPRKI